MTLDQLQAFVKIVQSGSFTRAADLMGTSKGYLSRVLAQLERELGAKLLERTTRTLSVTETGREIFERALAILGAVEDTRQVAQEAQGAPRGLLRLTCGVEFGTIAVNGWVREYLGMYPDASVDVEFTSRVVDIVHEGFDLAIRIGPLPPSRLVARTLGTLEYGLFACARHLARHGAPESVEQLRAQPLVMFSSGGHRDGWRLHQGREKALVNGPARLRVNNFFAVRDAVQRSFGIGLLPLLIAADGSRGGRLIPVLPEWKPAAVEVHAVYPSARYLSPKVRAFIDLATERFPREASAAREEIACRRPHRTAT